MILPLLLLQATVPAASAATDADRYRACLHLVETDPAAAEADAGQWQLLGGDPRARQCLGMALAAQGKWLPAAATFEVGAGEAERLGLPSVAATLHVQSGNAWLAGGDAAKARSQLGAAIAGGALIGEQLGAAYLDRARAAVATEDLVAARTDLDQALALTPGDATGWYLSAALARRAGDLPRARGDIAEAISRAPDMAALQLEAGRIALASDEPAGARAFWQRAIALAPDSAEAEAARRAIASLGVKK